MRRLPNSGSGDTQPPLVVLTLHAYSSLCKTRGPIERGAFCQRGIISEELLRVASKPSLLTASPFNSPPRPLMDSDERKAARREKKRQRKLLAVTGARASETSASTAGGGVEGGGKPAKKRKRRLAEAEAERITSVLAVSGQSADAAGKRKKKKEKKEKKERKRLKEAEAAAARKAPTAERDGGEEARAAKRARKEARHRQRALEGAQDDAAGTGGTAEEEMFGPRSEAEEEDEEDDEDEEEEEDEEAPDGAAGVASDGALEELDEGDDDGAGAAALAQLGWRGRRAFWKEVAAEVNAQLSDVRGPRPRPQIKEKVYTMALSRKGTKEDSATRGKVGRPRYLHLPRTTCYSLLATRYLLLTTHYLLLTTRWAGRARSQRRSLIGSSTCVTVRGSRGTSSATS